MGQVPTSMWLFSLIFYWKMRLFFAIVINLLVQIQHVNCAMTEEDVIQMEKKLDDLRQQHRLLDVNLSALGADNLFGIAQLKKKKLHLKDQIVLLERMLYPDIIA